MLNPLLLFLASLGCWSHLPLDQHVKDRALIVQATLITMDRAPSPSVVDEVVTWWSGRTPHRVDRGVLNISAVLKAPDATIAAPGSVVLIMASIDREPHISAEFTFQAGANGIWMLQRTAGGWTALRPDDLQPLAQMEAIRRHVADQAATAQR